MHGASVELGQLSCVRPVELPRLAPGMATGFVHDTVAHSWESYDHGGTSTLTNTRLTHETGPVSLRYGLDDKKRAYFLDEFKSLRMLGSDAAWLVEASLRTAETCLFVITGDQAGWASRFVGNPGSTVAISIVRDTGSTGAGSRC